MLHSKTAEELYFNHAQDQPIIDYHNHLSPQDIANDRKFETITDAWLAGDHYKWRAMRANGINEKFVTGSASKEEKFAKWAETVPYTLRNPLYHWTHLELSRYFDINELLSSKTQAAIYAQFAMSNCKARGNGCHGLLTQMKVKVACTTDDPIDNLEYHAQIAKPRRSVEGISNFPS